MAQWKPITTYKPGGMAAAGSMPSGSDSTMRGRSRFCRAGIITRDPGTAGILGSTAMADMDTAAGTGTATPATDIKAEVAGRIGAIRAGRMAGMGTTIMMMMDTTGIMTISR